MEVLPYAIPLGIGATATMDAWSLLRRRLFGLPAPDFALVGRWLALLPRGRFRHASIAAAPTVPHERLLGWGAHYAIGIAFAALLLAISGIAWIRDPELVPALAIGVVTVLAPFLLLQPGTGAGVFARRTPRPWRTRAHTLVNHIVFGVGLYLAGEALLALCP